MSLTLRQTKGSKLTIQEMDANLTYLESLIEASNSQVQYTDQDNFVHTKLFGLGEITISGNPTQVEGFANTISDPNNVDNYFQEYLRNISGSIIGGNGTFNGFRYGRYLHSSAFETNYIHTLSYHSLISKNISLDSTSTFIINSSTAQYSHNRTGIGNYNFSMGTTSGMYVSTSNSTGDISLEHTAKYDSVEYILNDIIENAYSKYDHDINSIILENGNGLTGSYRRITTGLSNIELKAIDEDGTGISTVTLNSSEIVSQISNITNVSSITTQNNKVALKSRTAADLTRYFESSVSPTAASINYIDASSEIYSSIGVTSTQTSLSYTYGGVDYSALTIKTLGDTFTGIEIVGVREYANVSAAQSAGLTSGQVFRTGSALQIVP